MCVFRRIAVGGDDDPLGADHTFGCREEVRTSVLAPVANGGMLVDDHAVLLSGAGQSANIFHGMNAEATRDDIAAMYLRPGEAMLTALVPVHIGIVGTKCPVRMLNIPAHALSPVWPVGKTDFAPTGLFGVNAFGLQEFSNQFNRALLPISKPSGLCQTKTSGEAFGINLGPTAADKATVAT